MKKNDSARFFLSISEKLSHSKNIVNQIHFNELLKSNLAIETGVFNQALEHAEKAAAYFKNTGYPQTELEANLLRVKALYKLKSYRTGQLIANESIEKL